MAAAQFVAALASRIVMLAAPGVVSSQPAMNAIQPAAPSVVPMNIHADRYGSRECPRGYERVAEACDRSAANAYLNTSAMVGTAIGDTRRSVSDAHWWKCLAMVARREQKKFTLRMRRASFRANRPPKQFDVDRLPKLNRALVHDLATGRYITERAPILIVGEVGVGKSDLAQALGHCAIRQGFDVLFTSCTQLAASLNAARATGAYEHKLATLARVAPDRRSSWPQAASATGR